MHFVENDVRVDRVKVVIGLWSNKLLQEHTRGHVQDARVWRYVLAVKTNLIATYAAQAPISLFAYATRHAHGRNATRLRDDYVAIAVLTAIPVEYVLRHLFDHIFVEIHAFNNTNTKKFN